MKSMTGFGRATASLGAHTLTAQVSSVNRKTLDLTVKLPEEWESLEPQINDLVRKYASRGKVHVDLELTGANGGQTVVWDETAVGETLAKLNALAAKQGVAFQPSSELFWQIANSQRKASELPSAETAQTVVLATLEAALKSFAEMRAREGATLLTDFLARVAIIQNHATTVAERAPQVPKNYREQLMQRLRQAGLELDLNDERVLKEIALFADRCDIAEELTRLRSHFEQFIALLKSNGEIGRKSEFILQEMGREVHTIGSKANDLTISRNVIELKNELERIREQIANVE
ncbi:MAG: YicC family protein [Verrucomicrobia bacterium]|nr:YicC family protein [Verrucomicrobiota bacterium]